MKKLNYLLCSKKYLGMFVSKVEAVAGKMEIGFLGIGFQPKWEDKDIPLIPKVLYNTPSNKLNWIKVLVQVKTLRGTTLFNNLPFLVNLVQQTKQVSLSFILDFLIVIDFNV